MVWPLDNRDISPNAENIFHKDLRLQNIPIFVISGIGRNFCISTRPGKYLRTV